MYIKQIIIDGFKSYGKRTIIEPFDPGHNVVVGRNGSGKSNFFSAIQFVLSDEFTRLTVKQRQELMFEGVGPRVISASVEIIFDNTDRRLPVEKNEVSLKRVIGLKKDQYILNKTMIERNDVMNLLEAAGLSRSNPYYIVKQGTINEMAMAPETRLKLLREVAGTNVYEEKRIESNKILKDTQSKLEDIQKILLTIDERLKVLKDEVKELQEFKKLDKQRRALEHIIHEHTLLVNKDKLHQLEQIHAELSEIQVQLGNMADDIQKRIKEANKEYKKAQNELQHAKEEETRLSAEQEQLEIKKNELLFLINDLREEVTKNNEDRTKITNELENLKIQIQEEESKLQNIIPQYEDSMYKEEEITRKLDLNKQKRKELYNKQGRSVQFKSKADRDLWINEELKQIDKQIEDKKRCQMAIEENLRKDEETHASLEKRVQECITQINYQKKSIDQFNTQYYNLKMQNEDLNVKCKDLYRQDQYIQDQLTTLKDDLAKADHNLMSMFGKSLVNGKRSVEKVLETFRQHPEMSKEISNYCGLVMENFDCDPQLYKSVEVTAGNRLFHHIVRTNKFGREILKEMNNQHLPGEVTFMPLDLLEARAVSYPSSKDAKPMIHKLMYNDECEIPMRFIFGRTLICRDMEIATSFARKYSLDCVTLEGDQASSRGWLKGGHFSNLKSPLKLQKERLHILEQISLLEKNSSSLKTEIEQTNCDISVCISEQQRTEMKVEKARDIYKKVKDEINVINGEIDTINANKILKKKKLQEIITSLEVLYTTKESLENELLQEFTEQLSEADQQQINILNDAITQLTKELKEITNKRLELQLEKNKIESILNENLIRKRNQLSEELEKISIEDKQQSLKESIAQLPIIEEKILKNKVNLEEQKTKVLAATEEEEQKLRQLKEEKAHEKEILERIDIGATKLEQITTKENIVKQNIENCRQKIVDLGVVPSKEFRSKFEKKDEKELFKILGETKDKLKNYDRVNQKALDQFDTFTDQRKNLHKRKEELDKGYEKIQQLMDVLQQRKFEAIEFTFKQVSKYFSEIFEKLVPNGYAQLVIKTVNERSIDSDSISDSSINLDHFLGIDIKVSFTGKTGEMKYMNHLSGGQKSLLALTLIFAIQKCDPAPFYLFDEIDQALDVDHRIAVANMIHELSAGAQFIIITFSLELLQHANKFYGVKIQNNLSSIECVSRESATNFIDDY